ncbi:MAG: carboxypeptidase regulatory-like domain-containing protein [Planctomycetota bacterium]
MVLAAAASPLVTGWPKGAAEALNELLHRGGAQASPAGPQGGQEGRERPSMPPPPGPITAEVEGTLPAAQRTAAETPAGSPAPTEEQVTPPQPAAPAVWLVAIDAATRAPLSAFRAWTKVEVDVPEVSEPSARELQAVTAATPLAVPRGRTLTVAVEAPGYAPWRRSGLRANTPDAPLLIELEQGVPIVGRVHDAATGAPVAGALVLVETALPHDVIDVHGSALTPLPLHATHTDALGVYRIDHAPAGEVLLRASHVGYAPGWSATLQLERASAEAPSAPLELPSIALAAGGVVEGKVERPDGTPFANATIILSTMAPRGDVGADAGGVRARVMSYGQAVTDETGSYRIEDLPQGYFVALCLGDLQLGGAFPRLQQTTVDSARVTRVDFLADTRSTQLSGLLLDAAGAPLGEVDLSLFQVENGGWRATRTDREGRFLFLDVPPGLWAICRAAHGFADQQVLRMLNIEEPQGQPRPSAGSPTLEVEVRIANGAFSARTLDPDGATLRGGRVSLEREDATGTLRFHATSALDAAGELKLAGLPAGRYVATITADELGLGHVRLAPFDLGEGAEWHEDVRVPRGGSLEVLVSDAQGRATESSFVTVTDASGSELMLGLDSRTDAGGQKRFTCLSAGVYTIEVQTFGGQVARGSVEVREGEVATLRVTLGPR